jgi:hypothetical protein
MTGDGDCSGKNTHAERCNPAKAHEAAAEKSRCGRNPFPRRTVKPLREAITGGG